MTGKIVFGTIENFLNELKENADPEGIVRLKRGSFDDLCTYGDVDLIGKVACWFQPRDLRKLEAMLVKDAFLRYWKEKLRHDSMAFKAYIVELKSRGFFTCNRLRLKDLKAFEKMFERYLKQVEERKKFELFIPKRSAKREHLNSQESPKLKKNKISGRKIDVPVRDEKGTTLAVKQMEIEIEGESGSESEPTQINKEDECKKDIYMELEETSEEEETKVSSEWESERDTDEDSGLITTEPKGSLKPDGRLFLRYKLGISEENYPDLGDFKNIFEEGVWFGLTGIIPSSCMSTAGDLAGFFAGFSRGETGQGSHSWSRCRFSWRWRERKISSKKIEKSSKITKIIKIVLIEIKKHWMPLTKQSNTSKAIPQRSVFG